MTFTNLDIPGITTASSATLKHLRDKLLGLLDSTNQLKFENIASQIEELHAKIEILRKSSNNETFLNALFVSDKYIHLINNYCRTWQLIYEEKYSESWNTLQNCLDAIRLVKRFSNIDVVFLERQLLELESAYPYNLFASIGIRVRMFECSICGKDIDSKECPHRRLGLYSGVMAYGIAKEITSWDHVALVEYPVDKRCVVQFEDTDPQFRIIRYIRHLLDSPQFSPLALDRLEWKKIRVTNPEYKKLGRNEPCFCESGLKFKKCCIHKKTIEQDHVDVIAELRDLNTVLPKFD